MIQTALGSSRELGGAAKHLIDGSEKRICQLSFDFKSLYIIERRKKEICKDYNNPLMSASISY